MKQCEEHNWLIYDLNDRLVCKICTIKWSRQHTGIGRAASWHGRNCYQGIDAQIVGVELG